MLVQIRTPPRMRIDLRMKTTDTKNWQSSDLVRGLEVIGGKWKAQITFHLFSGTKRFSELCRLLGGIRRGVLSYELKQLHADGIIERTQYETIPPTVEYALTERGKALEPVLRALQRWIHDYGTSE
jgi:DNA-binding HxlR family transcriptional regulator